MIDKFCALCLFALWIINLFNGTGLDSVYQVTRISRHIIAILALLFFLINQRNKKILFSSSSMLSIVFFLMSFLLSGFHNNTLSQTTDYLNVFLLIYILSNISFNNRIVFYISRLYCIAGLIILFIYEFGSGLDGWNSNSIAMLGLYSFLFYLIPYFAGRTRKDSFTVLLISVLYFVLLWKTDSRSCILFGGFSILCMLNIVHRDFAFKTKHTVFLLLFIPLIVALVVAKVSSTTFMNRLDLWSITFLKKPFFNGRDVLWKLGFDKYMSAPFWGIGSMTTHNWHNSAVTCLVAFGAIGYLAWINVLRVLIEQARPFIYDDIVQGCIIAFIVSYIQQSLELGLISSSPTILPYVMLGVLFGRIKHLLKSGESSDTRFKYYNSNIQR